MNFEQKLLARIKELEKALRWYIENDETFEGGEWEYKNEYWLTYKRNAEKLLADKDYLEK